MTETTQGRKTGHALKRHILQSNHTTTIIPLHSTVITQSSHKRVAFQSSHCQHKEWPLLYIHSLWRITLHTRLAWLHRQDKDSELEQQHVILDAHFWATAFQLRSLCSVWSIRLLRQHGRCPNVQVPWRVRAHRRCQLFERMPEKGDTEMWERRQLLDLASDEGSW